MPAPLAATATPAPRSASSPAPATTRAEEVPALARSPGIDLLRGVSCLLAVALAFGLGLATERWVSDPSERWLRGRLRPLRARKTAAPR